MMSFIELIKTFGQNMQNMYTGCPQANPSVALFDQLNILNAWKPLSHPGNVVAK